jgi:ribonuclease Z
MTPRQVAGLAVEAGVKALALTHLVPPSAERAALVAEIRETYRGPVIVGEDLLTIDPGARTVAFPGLHLAY